MGHGIRHAFRSSYTERHSVLLALHRPVQQFLARHNSSIITPAVLKMIYNPLVRNHLRIRTQLADNNMVFSFLESHDGW